MKLGFGCPVNLFSHLSQTCYYFWVCLSWSCQTHFHVQAFCICKFKRSIVVSSSMCGGLWQNCEKDDLEKKYKVLLVDWKLKHI